MTRDRAYPNVAATNWRVPCKAPPERKSSHSQGTKTKLFECSNVCSSSALYQNRGQKDEIPPRIQEDSVWVYLLAWGEGAELQHTCDNGRIVTETQMKLSNSHVHQTSTGGVP